MTACYITPTDNSYGTRKLAHYNAWLCNPKRDIGAGPYPGFPEDMKLARARKSLQDEFVARAVVKAKVVATKPVKVERAKKIAGAPSKLDCAIELYKANQGLARVNLIQLIKDELVMSSAGASTYYYNAKKAAGH